MTYRPPKTNRKAAVLSLVSAVFSVFCFFFSSFMAAPILYQITGLALAVIALQVYMKFVQCDYVYEVTDNDLKIHKVTGKKSLTVCSMSLEESMTGVLGAEYVQKNVASLPKNTISLNFCKNIFCEDYAFYFFNFNGKIARLKFEPDEAFAARVNQAIAGAKKRAAYYASEGSDESERNGESDEND